MAEPQRCLIVFFDPEKTRYEWLLKPGFRHVFCAIDDGTYWIMWDARDGRTVTQVVQASDYDLADFFEKKGYKVLEIEQGPPLKAPLITANCVGLVKAVCSISAPLAITPWQLYRRLTRKRAK